MVYRISPQAEVIGTKTEKTTFKKFIEDKRKKHRK